MLKLSTIAAAMLLMATPVAQARTSQNVLFTCEGELVKNAGGYEIDEISAVQDENYPMVCYIDEGKVLRQVLAVCRVGDFCTVGAKGESGNGNRHLIQKVFEVQRQPTSRVQELREDFKK